MSAGVWSAPGRDACRPARSTPGRDRAPAPAPTLKSLGLSLARIAQFARRARGGPAGPPRLNGRCSTTRITHLQRVRRVGSTLAFTCWVSRARVVALPASTLHRPRQRPPPTINGPAGGQRPTSVLREAIDPALPRPLPRQGGCATIHDLPDGRCILVTSDRLVGLRPGAVLHPVQGRAERRRLLGLPEQTADLPPQPRWTTLTRTSSLAGFDIPPVFEIVVRGSSAAGATGTFDPPCTGPVGGDRRLGSGCPTASPTYRAALETPIITSPPAVAGRRPRRAAERSARSERSLLSEAQWRQVS